jgi:hypothetical protein
MKNKQRVYCEDCKYDATRCLSNPYCIAPRPAETIIMKESFYHKSETYKYNNQYRTDNAILNKNNNCKYYLGKIYCEPNWLDKTIKFMGKIEKYINTLLPKW